MTVSFVVKYLGGFVTYRLFCYRCVWVIQLMFQSVEFTSGITYVNSQRRQNGMLKKLITSVMLWRKVFDFSVMLQFCAAEQKFRLPKKSSFGFKLFHQFYRFLPLQWYNVFLMFSQLKCVSDYLILSRMLSFCILEGPLDVF